MIRGRKVKGLFKYMEVRIDTSVDLQLLKEDLFPSKTALLPMI